MLHDKPLIAVTQRVERLRERPERRCGLDEAWFAFLDACGCIAAPLPNHREQALALFNGLPIDGLLLSGGEDLAVLGGAAADRDALELELLSAASARGLPVAGVCRGMHVIQHLCGVPLMRVRGHVARRQTIVLGGQPDVVNSFHNYGTTETRPELEVWGRARDGVVKAVRHVRAPILGVMWHPERLAPFAQRDIDLFSGHFTPAPQTIPVAAR